MKCSELYFFTFFVNSLQFYTNKIEEIQSIIAKAQEYENSLDRGIYKD